MTMMLVAMLSVLLPATLEPRSLEAQIESLELSCAAFPSGLSESDLVARYGAENVRSAPVFGSDDGPQDGTVVFHDTDNLKLDIVWWDAVNRTNPHWIRARGAGSRWQGPNGIRVGMDALTIERANGWPFRLGGFSLEGGQGLVRSWGNGRFKKADGDGCAVRISLLPTGDHDVDPKLARQVFSGEFSSGHPAMQALNPRVVSISVTHDWRC